MLGSAMAVLNRRFPLRVVASVADVAEPAAAFEALLETGFVRWFPSEVGTPVEYVHPLFRAAVYDDLSPTLRHDLHVAAARALDPEDALVHRVAAYDRGDHELLDDLVRLAGTAEGRREFGLSATYWLWVSSLSEGQERGLVEFGLLQGARLLVADGQFQRAQDLRGQLEATTLCPLRSLLLGLLAWESGDSFAPKLVLTMCWP